ncbi:MAG TPA: DUF3048 domain-containing protein [Chloroflexota bacterium]
MSELLSRRNMVRLLTCAPALVLLSSCVGKAAPAPTPAPAAAIATPTAFPTSAPPVVPPTATVAAPVATATVAPTATEAASSVSVPAATATPGSTPAPVSAAALNAQFPNHPWDFALRPILFQIDNAPDARPQSGLSSAYVVYETLAEGNITRFTGLFLQKALADIGNLRSARIVDTDLTQQWDAILMHVGASTPVQQLLNAAGITQMDLDLTDNRPAAYRTSDRVAPYNLYTSLERLRPLLAGRGVRLTATSPRAFPVGPLPPGITSKPAASLTIPFGSPSDAGYAWDGAAQGYRRSVDGSGLVDANTGKPIIVTNVVAQFAREIVTNIIEDSEGSHSLQFVQTGTGKAVLLRNQQRIDLTWRRDQPKDLTTFAFPDGSPATFAPGNVWISFLPDSMQLA